MGISLAAISGDEAAVSRLFQHGFTGTVTAVFDHTLHITAISGKLYALATNTHGNAPSTIRLAAEAGFSFPGIDIHAGERVTAKEKTLAIGDKLTIAANDIILWKCQLPVFPDRRRLAISIPLLREVISRQGADGGLKSYIAGISEQPGMLISTELARRADRLFTYLLQAELSRSVEAGTRLLGLGQGSTPSGDDFLAGLILTMHMPGALFPDGHLQFARAIAGQAPQITTQVSAQMLEHAVRGEAHETVINLLAAIYGKEKETVIRYARQVLTLGGLSGTDLLAGIITGFELGLHFMHQAKER